MGGVVPVPITVGNNDEHKLKLFNVWEILDKPNLVTNTDILNDLEIYAQKHCLEATFNQIKAKTIILENVLQNACAPSTPGEITDPKPSDIAIIQFSSGSTGNPKGIVLTHENIITNIKSIIDFTKFDESDSFLSWMPLTHDMGLNYHLIPLVMNINQYLMPTALFIRRPVLWLKKAYEYKATVLSSPNFGYQYFLSYFKPELAEEWDLSRIRFIFNGAEPISAKLCNEFLDTMGEFGLKRSSMYTVYGLAEASVAVAFPPPGAVFDTVNLDRKYLGVGETVKEIKDTNNIDLVTFVDEGFPINDCWVRICDDEDRELDNYRIGYIQIKGKNVTSGYSNDPVATAKAYTEDGWLKTGDLGFMRNGRLVVTGRAKDIIFINGQNYYPHDIERVAEEVEGAVLGKVVSFGAFNDKLQKEELNVGVLFKKKPVEFIPIMLEIKKRIRRQIGIEVKNVIPLRDIPKTTSGKLQRYKLAESYLKGEFSPIIAELDQLIQDHVEQREIVIPRTETEKILARICRDVLGREDIGIYDNFLELGGDSITLTQVQAELDKIYPGKVGIANIFTYPNIASLAKFIDKNNLDGYHRKIDNDFNLNPASNLVFPNKDLPDSTDCAHKCATPVPANFSWHFKKNLNVLAGSRFKEVKEVSNTDIAIIGIGARLPVAKGLDDFWESLKNGIELTGNFPENRRKDVEDYFRFKEINPDEFKYLNSAYLEAIDQFDYAQFHLTPKEASLMNPVMRLFLETAWESIADAGYSDLKIAGSRTGVYLGFISDLEGYKYKQMIQEIDPSLIPVSVTGNLSAIIPSRISYLLNLKGPSLLIDTACSSSLVAVHLACQAIKNGECDMAIAGAARINLFPLDKYEEKIGIESSDQRTRTFDDNSDGAGMGEGAVTVLLKSLHKALRDNDNIYAVIKGSAINQDGNSTGITAPNPEAQADVIINAWKSAGINPESISYIEAHGTGTKLGDAIEMNGLQMAFERFTTKNQFCAIGSIKTNLGHLYECAGIAGLLKTILILKHKEFPPSIHFNLPNRKIDFMNSPVYVNIRLQKWNKEGTPLRCGISSFGFSGTNCHLVVEEAPRMASYESETTPEHPYLFVLSARSMERLRKLMKHYQELELNPQMGIENICFTASTGRNHYQHRMAMIVNHPMDLIHKINQISSQPFEFMNQSWFFYGWRRIVPDEKEIRKYGEIKESENRELTDLANQKLSDFLRTGKHDENLLHEIAKLYVQGAEINWELFYQGEKVKRLSLPTYPFDYKRCWIEIPKKVCEENLDYFKTEKCTGIVELTGRDDQGYTEIEKKITEVCHEVLGFQGINIYDSFFELDVDSILLTRIHKLLEGIFPGQILVTDLFEYPTIYKLSQFIASKQGVSKLMDQRQEKDSKKDIEALVNELEIGNISISQVIEGLKKV